jgi:DNA-directed RNA polymerase III subunit RPC4
MTASGPFAMGPTLAGSSIRRSAPRSNFAPTAPVSRTSTSFGNNHPLSSAPLSLKNDVGNTDDNVRNGIVKAEDGEYYSDPDEGVEIVDMENVHQLDWMAPDSIKKERQSEDEELEDIVEDFASQANIETVRFFRRSELHCVEVSALGRRHAGGKTVSFPISYSISYIFFQDDRLPSSRSNT